MNSRNFRFHSVILAFAALFLCSTDGFAQTVRATVDMLPERSSLFQPTFEEVAAQTIRDARMSALEDYHAEDIERLQNIERENYGAEQYSLSLDLFRSLASYLRGRSYQAQATNDRILQESVPASRVAAEARLLSALEFFAHSPLRRADVETGLDRLTGIIDPSATSAAIQPEIRFWMAEGYRALGQLSQAEEQYSQALQKSSDPRLTALTEFRLGELFERQERYPAADTAFQRAASHEQSPLRLLSMLRRAAVLRSAHRYTEVLTQLQQLDTAYANSSKVIRTSARDLRSTSPLIEELILETTEADRLFASAPNGGIPKKLAVAEAQLVSPYFPSEIALVRGSALSELGQYEQATDILSEGERLLAGADSSTGVYLNEQARFVSNALKFEKAWSLFQRAKYSEAASSFLQLAAEDTIRRHILTRDAALPLREQGAFFDPFLSDTLVSYRTARIEANNLVKSTIDTSFFFYNDFPERARFYAGVALARLGDRRQAAEVFRQLAQDKSVLYSDRANYQLALIRFAEQNYQAQELLEPLSYQRTVTGAYASFLLGELAYRKNIFERADRYFVNAFENLPLTDTAIRATAHLERGLSLIPLKNWQEASQELEAYLRLTTDTATGKADEALYWLGRSYLRSGEYDSARITFERFFNRFPRSPRSIDAQYSYAWSLFQVNDFAAAEPAFERVISLDSISRYSYDALARAGDAYYAMGNYLAANKIYNQAVDRPAFNELRTTRALAQLGSTRLLLDSSRSAMNEFGYITTKYKNSDIVDLAYYDLALSAYAINQPDRAEDAVEQVVSKFSNSSIAPKALLLAAQERDRVNDLRGSVAFYQRVVRNYPRSIEAGPALFQMQEALVNLKRVPEALAVADTFVARNPANSLNPSIFLRSGELKLRVGESQRALESFQEFVRTYPTHVDRPQAELDIARAQLALGDTTRALQQFTAVARNYDSLIVASFAFLEKARIERRLQSTSIAAQDYQNAFHPRYYSSDAAPTALTEYAQLLIDIEQPDSAVRILHVLADRYPVEASVSARGLLRSASLLTTLNRLPEARSDLARVIAAHPKDALGGAATVRMGEAYLAEEDWASALSSFAASKRDFPLTVESETRRLFGQSTAHMKRGQKADAIRDLQALVSLRGVQDADESRARVLLNQLAPPKKSKAKSEKGSNGDTTPSATKKPAAKKGKKG